MDELKVIKYKNQDLTKKYIEKLSVEDREEIAEYLFRYFRERGFPYPEFSEKELLVILCNKAFCTMAPPNG